MPLTNKQKALRKKWVAALRSGKFRQGRERLVAEDRYCCLGVAASVCWPRCKFDEKTCSNAWLSNEAEDELGITTADAGALAALNDGGVPFCDIAALIENLPAPDEA